MQDTTILTRGDNASYEMVDDEAILIDVATGIYFSLNKVGTQFWEMLDGRSSIANHAQTLATQYDVDVAMVTADLLELAGKMAADNLVVTSVS